MKAIDDGASSKAGGAGGGASGEELEKSNTEISRLNLLVK